MKPGAAIGPYRVTGELGRGAAGRVLRAQGPDGRQVALKLMLWGAQASPKVRQRFLREAAVLSKLDHPGLIRLYDQGEHRGLPFLVMELIEGQSLGDLLEREGPLPLPAALQLGHELSLALAHAHERGILHRDLKPANVLLDREGRPHLGDFGLHSDLERTLGQSRLTHSHAALGSPGYWPPEQAQGRLDEVGPASDVFGLCATLYAVLTGRSPYGRVSNLVEALTAVDRPLTPVARLRPGIPRWLAETIDRGLAFEPGARPASAAEIARAFARKRAPEGGRPRPSGRWVQLAAGGLLLLGVGGAGGVLLLAEQVRAPGAGGAESASSSAPPATSSWPGTGEACAVLAKRLLDEGRLAEAGAAAEHGLQLDPSDLSCTAYLSRVRLRQGEFAEAVELGRAGLKAPAPASFTAVGSLFDGLRALERYQELIDQVQPLIGANPMLDPVFRGHLGMGQVGLGQFEAALPNLEAALEQKPDNLAVRQMLSTALIGLDRPDEALEACRQGLELAPQDWSFRFNTAQAYALQARPDAALAMLDEALALPGLEDFARLATLRKRGFLLCAVRRFAEALPVLEPLLERPQFEDDEGLLTQYAECLLGLGRPREALQALDRAVERFPANHDAWIYRSVVQLRLLRPAESLRDAEQALQAGAPPATCHNNRSAALRQLGRIEEALAAADAALAIDGSLRRARFHRAMALALLARLPEAVGELEQVVAGAPPGEVDDEAELALRRLRTPADQTGPHDHHEVEVAVLRETPSPEDDYLERVEHALRTAPVGVRDRLLIRKGLAHAARRETGPALRAFDMALAANPCSHAALKGVMTLRGSTPGLALDYRRLNVFGLLEARDGPRGLQDAEKLLAMGETAAAREVAAAIEPVCQEGPLQSQWRDLVRRAAAAETDGPQ